MEGRVKTPGEDDPKSRSLLDVTLYPAAIRIPDRGIDTWGRLKLLVAFHGEVSSGESGVIYCSKAAFPASESSVSGGCR